MLIRRPMMTGFVFIAGVLLYISFAMVLQPTAAQSEFATNTPPPTLAGFATNTPQPDPASFLPDAGFERYALRLWDEATLVDVLMREIRELDAGSTERVMAIRLLQNELARRFPGAPHDPETRQQVIETMLMAPRGSVDIRPAMRAYIAGALNETQPSLSEMSSFEFGGFNITIMTADFDGNDRPDALIRTRFPALTNTPSELRYESFSIAERDVQGNYAVYDTAGLIPAAPLYDVESINLERLSDVNRDGLDEVVLSVNRNEVNKELFIFGWRNGAIINLIQPGARILFGTIADFPLNGANLTVEEYRVESPAWGCLGERDVTWSWNFNFFRPPGATDSFSFQNRLACLLYGAEPIFEQPVGEAMNTIESIVPLAQSGDEMAVQRASMMLAMLRVLNSDISEALEQVRGLQASAEPGSWLEQQTTAFLDTATQSNVTPIILCAALQEANAYGACDVDQVLTRLFQETPLSRDEPIDVQLGRLGITVADQVTVSEIGKLNRQAVHFNLAGDHWWAFVPLQADSYTAERIDPLPGYERALAPTLVIFPPVTAFDALLVNGDPAEALNILDNAVRDNPGAGLASSGKFLQALCYDLLGDRRNARPSYFQLWTDDPLSVWGQLAAEHLEKR